MIKRQPKEKPPLEDVVKAECLKWLNNQPHIWAWRRNIAAIAMPQKKGPPRWIRFGQPGMADLTGIVGVMVEVVHPVSLDGEREGGIALDERFGVHLEVEVKRAGAKPNPDQAAWLAAADAAGAIAIWAHSVEMLEEKLRAAFLLRGWWWPE